MMVLTTFLLFLVAGLVVAETFPENACYASIKDIDWLLVGLNMSNATHEPILDELMNVTDLPPCNPSDSDAIPIFQPSSFQDLLELSSSLELDELGPILAMASIVEAAQRGSLSETDLANFADILSNDPEGFSFFYEGAASASYPESVLEKDQ